MRLIDADGLLKALSKFDDYEYGNWYFLDGIETATKIVNNAPTVDAVEVVRCKDCYYCATEKSFGKEYLYCDAFYEHAEGDLIGVSLMVEPNHFCAYGERREDD